MKWQGLTHHSLLSPFIDGAAPFQVWAYLCAVEAVNQTLVFPPPPACSSSPSVHSRLRKSVDPPHPTPAGWFLQRQTLPQFQDSRHGSLMALGLGTAQVCTGCGWVQAEAWVRPLFTNYREAVTAEFPEETKARVWFPLRLSNFLPGHSASSAKDSISAQAVCKHTRAAWSV